MLEYKDQCWVTSALDDQQCLAAIVLCRSLRRVLTNRKIVVLTTGSVSPAFRDILEEEFSAVVQIESKDCNKSNIPWNSFVKISCWQLTLFVKCVFIEAESLVVENCDEIFESEEFSTTQNLSLFVCKPSFAVYKRFLQLFQTKNGNNQDFLQYCFDQSKSTNGIGKLLPAKYEVIITDASIWEEILAAKVNVVNFQGKRPWQQSELSGRKIVNHQCLEIFSQVWKNIFVEDILSRLAPEMVSSMKLANLLPESIFATQESTKLHISKEYNEQLNEAIAVIGLSCRFPGANDANEFWELLVNGKDAVRPVPLRRWDTKDIDSHEVLEEDLRKTNAGFLKCAIDEFDAKFYGISPREATFLDPQQRLLLEVAWEGLENAGIDPLSLKGSKTGVFIGVWTADYEALLRKHTSGSNAHRVYLGNAYSATSARVSFFLGLNGPNIATESGCSSSFVSLHLACESLRKGESNLVMAGGVNLLLHPFSLIGAEKPYFMAGDGHCKPFDAKADGFGRAEGCGIVVLKRLADAIKDGDRIEGVIRGSAMNMEGTTASFGTPSKICQEIAIKEAVKNSKVDPSKISYVEAHGTGTMVGDPIEVSAMVETYSKGRLKPLPIGSVKGNIGHCEGAAGVAGLIKVLLAMKNKTIPPHRNFESLNPDIPLDKIPGRIPVEAEKWEVENGESRIAAISSFSISGTNVHVIVEEPPNFENVFLQSLEENKRSLNILTLSAKSENALTELTKKYKTFLQDNGNLNINDIAYTANVCRAKFPYRLAVIGKNSAELISQLNKNQFISGNATSNKNKIAFLFTGQGSQYPRMAKALYESNIVFKNSLDTCEKILQNHLGISILNEIWAEKEKSRLDQTLFSQISIFCIEYSLLKLWNSLGIYPDFVFGHSVGEFSAATAAGIMKLEDALKLVSNRSKLIQSLPPGGMLAIKSNADSTKILIDKFMTAYPNGLWLDIAVVNSADEVVVAGPPNALEMFAELCSQENVKTQKVAATHAFHSREMEKILEKFGQVAESISYASPKCGYISGGDGRQLQKSDLNAKYWQNHARNTVNFPLGLKTLHEADCRVFLEIGPHPVLLALALNNLTAEESQECLWVPSIRKTEQEWQTILNSVGKLYVKGCPIDFKGLHNSSQRKKLELPTYPFQRKRYWFESTSEQNTLICNTKVLHPLLGKHVPVATNDMSVNIYQQLISVDNLSYLTDHVVANKIIMPGAGFLEMLLATANLSIQGDHDSFSDPRKPFRIEDFVVEAPLELSNEKASRLQVICVPFSSDSKDIKKAAIFRKMGDNVVTPWKKHVSARLNLAVHDIPSEWSNVLNLDDVKSRCTEEVSTADMYTKIAEVGIAFGPTFRSIKKVWKGENEALLDIVAPLTVTDRREYICHPIAIDAMLQAYAFQLDLENIGLYLPVAIEKFTWLSRKTSERLFLHVLWETSAKNQRQGTIKLLNECGEILGVMEGVRLVKTTLAAFVNFLNAQKKELPGMLKEVFRPKTGLLMSRVDLKRIPSPKSVLLDLEKLFVENENSLDYDVDKVRAISEKLCMHIYMKALLDLGWNPSVGQTFVARELMTDLLISFRHERYVNRILEIFEMYGILKALTKNTWRIVESIPKKCEMDKIIAQVEEAMIKEAKKKLIDLPVLRRTSKFLSQVLQDKESPLSVLFPENCPEENAATIYSSADFAITANKAILAICEKLFDTVDKSNCAVRILEIGAGTGSTTEYVIAAFNKMNIPFTYVFTDISPIFLDQAKQKFKDISRMTYKLLNIESDPKSQGFAPHQFDLVICSNVLHATADLLESMKNIRNILVPSGYLLILEMFRPIFHVDLIFGMLEGYWRFRDLNIRSKHPLVGIDQWMSLAKASEFTETHGSYTTSDRGGVIVSRAGPENILYDVLKETENESKPSWLIFGSIESQVTFDLKMKLEKDGRKTLLITQGSAFIERNGAEFSFNPLVYENYAKLFEWLGENRVNLEGMIYLWSLGATEKDQDNIVAGLLHYTQALLKYYLKALPKLFLVSRGMYYVGDEGPTDPTTSLLRGLIMSLKSEQPGMKISIVDLDPNEVYESDVMGAEIFGELWPTEREPQVALRQRKRFVKRLVLNEGMPAPLMIPNSQRYKLQLPETNAVADLLLAPAEIPDIPTGHYEILVKATGLNFRDLFVILKPDFFHSLFWEVGLEFSGVVTKAGLNSSKFNIGDVVFGFTLHCAIASHTVVKESTIMRKPTSITHAEAATMPTVFFTAYISLVEIAKINSNDTVLIHVASGGVGLAAIQICRQVGSKVIATAGSRRKKAFLKSLGIEHVFHSRNTSYGDDILAITGGAGVDVVLNSLTGNNFKETSLKICKPHARFIEMSKINIWKVEEVKKLRPDIGYTIINLEHGMDDFARSAAVEAAILEGRYKPLPYTSFDVTQTKEAFDFFQKAQHIGKIVVTIPEVEYSKGNLTVSKNVFNQFATYIITGGLGGIGIEVAKYMARSGAQNIVLIGRNPPNANTVDVIASMTSKGINVITRQADVGKYNEMKDLFTDLENSEMNLPPIRGVMHAAGFISDGVISNQTLHKFKEVLNAKVSGVWNLHNLTKNYNLEHFVIYSSVAGLIGPLGQPNHAAANAFLDTFAHYRHALGLPVQTINWGAWAEIGVAANLNLSVAKDGAFGIKPFSPTQGIAALEATMKYHYLQVAIVEIDMNQFKQDPLNLGVYIEELTSRSETEVSAELAAEGEKIWKEIKETTPEKRAAVIQSHLEGMIRQTLKLPAEEPLDENQNFSDMGLDSLMAVEMRNKLQLVFGKNITINTTALLDNPNIRSLSDHLADLITTCETSNGISGNKKDSEVGNLSEEELVAADSILPATTELTSEAVSLSQIKNILLTGATGQIGIYILYELVKRGQNVFCLIRAKSDEDALKKLKLKLKKNKLFDKTNLESVHCLAGNIVKSNLGLSQEVYNRLEGEIDAVIHYAVKSNHVEEYKAAVSGFDIRSVNVSGTVNILKFAAGSRTKHVLHASSFVAASKCNVDGTLGEDLPSCEDSGSNISWGYATSKFICEKLIRQAMERGIPCTVHRYPTIIGDSETGMFFPETNHLMMFLLACMHLGVAPKVHGQFSSLPVNLAAEASIQLFFDPKVGGGSLEIDNCVYNITNPHVTNQVEMNAIMAARGYTVEIVSEDQWTEALSSKGEDSLFYSFKDLYLKRGLTSMVNSTPTGALAFTVEAKGALFSVSTKLQASLPGYGNKIPKTADAFRKHLDYADQEGVFKMLNIT